MYVVSYPSTDKSYQYIHTQVDIRPTLEPKTRKLCSFISVVLYPPTHKHIINTRTYTHLENTTYHKQTNCPIHIGSLHKQDKHDQEPVFTAVARIGVHVVYQPQFRSITCLTYVTTHHYEPRHLS